jgi:hypothetical protein
MPDFATFQWDAFISHASEDKTLFVEPLAAELKKYGLKIWFDKFSLRIGSSLRESIDEGLADSKFGIVVLSPAFFAKNWPQRELNGLFSRQVNGQDVILPVWHGLSKEDLLRYSPLLSDIVAANSSEGVMAVARSLVEVIHPEAFQFDATREQAQNAAARLRGLFKDLHPALDSRVIFGPQEIDPLKTIGTQGPPGVIFSGAQDGMRVEIFAPDREEYNKNPLSFTLRMTTEAWKKLQTAQNEGRPVELGPKEVLGVASKFAAPFNIAVDSGFSAVQRLIVGPSADVMQRRLRIKLTFALGQEREEFSYIEFKVIRPGQEEFEIRSSSSTLPLQISLTLNLAGRPSDINITYSFAGHEIRQVYKALNAIRLLSEGGNVEMLDLESGRCFGTLTTAQLTFSSEDADLYSLVQDVYRVITAFNETVIWPQRITEADCIHLQSLAELVNTGRVAVPGDNVTMNLVPFNGVDLEETLRGQTLLRVDSDIPPTFATLFGKTLNLGPYQMIIRPREFQIAEDEQDPNSRIVSITPAEPVLFQIERFVGSSPPSASAA